MCPCPQTSNSTTSSLTPLKPTLISSRHLCLDTCTVKTQILQHTTSPCLALRFSCQHKPQNMNITKPTLLRAARIVAVVHTCLFLHLVSIYCNMFRLWCKRLSSVWYGAELKTAYIALRTFGWDLNCTGITEAGDKANLYVLNYIISA